MKRSIHLHQPARQTFDTALCTLPPSISLFLANAVMIPLETVPHLWTLLKDVIWGMLPDDERHLTTLEAFKMFGYLRHKF